MITYQHEAFIGQAIESVLAQETDFSVELVIGDDASPDNTWAIAEDFARRHPGRIRVLPVQPNLGVQPNFIRIFDTCESEFIALVEGDDYWTDPTKLQRQVDALRIASDCAMCFHDAAFVYEYHSTSAAVPSEQPATFGERFGAILPVVGSVPARFSQIEIARNGWFMPTASMLFRASSLPQPLPAWFAGVFSGDYTLQLLSTRSGNALYLPRLMSAYRLHAGGVMQAKAQTRYQIERRIHENLIFKKLLPRSVHANPNYLLSLFYLDLSAEEGKEGKRLQQAYYYFKGLTVDPVNFKRHLKRLVGKLTGANGAASA